MSNFTMDDILSRLIELQQKPRPFTPGDALFWDDPHISAQMLELFLNPDIDGPSRRATTIDRCVNWLIEALGLKPGHSVLDLGCGPGLYASRLARAGLRVTGVDYSRRSVQHACRYARENDLTIAYRHQDYLELEDDDQYDAILLIAGDYCPLDPEQRKLLLQNVHRALKPDGQFVLDVTTRQCRKKHGVRNRWRAMAGGFWKPGRHLVLDEGFDYPEQSIWLDQYTVVEPDGTVSVYRNWFQDYTPDSIAAELERGGFAVESTWGDLTGAACTPDDEWIGLVTRKGQKPASR